MRENLVGQLLKSQIGAEAFAVSALTGGQVGRVFRADTAGGRYAVKFVRAFDDPPFPDEPRDNRVYGARWSNLAPAYRLMRDSAIATPTLHATGAVASEGLRYAILDYLEGDPDDFSRGWFAALGRSLGRLHRVTRPWQGWIGMAVPYAEPWARAFAESLTSRLADARPFLTPELHERTARQIADAGPIGEPEVFVLSHTDGFQGLLARTDGAWRLLGVIDIEDHQFTDPRFVLAGLDLQHAMEGRAIPGDFWRGYAAETGEDRRASEHKTLFQLYYLLTWIRVLQGQEAPLANCLAKLAELLGP